MPGIRGNKEAFAITIQIRSSQVRLHIHLLLQETKLRPKVGLVRSLGGIIGFVIRCRCYCNMNMHDLARTSAGVPVAGSPASASFRRVHRSIPRHADRTAMAAEAFIYTLENHINLHRIPASAVFIQSHKAIDRSGETEKTTLLIVPLPRLWPALFYPTL